MMKIEDYLQRWKLREISVHIQQLVVEGDYCVPETENFLNCKMIYVYSMLPGNSKLVT